MAYYGNESDSECGCYVAYPLPWCCGAIEIPQLNDGASYKAVIEDHLGTVHEQSGLVVSSNKATIDTTELPSGFFNPFAGSYFLKVYNELDLDTPVSFIFGSATYNCLQLTFKDITPVPASAEIK